MRVEDRNQTGVHTVLDYRLIVQRDILLATEASVKFHLDSSYHPQNDPLLLSSAP